MKTVKIREKQQETYRNIDVTGCTISISQVTVANYSASHLIPRLENIQVKGILKRMSGNSFKDNILFNETLKNLLYLSEWDSPVFQFIKGYQLPLLLDGPNPNDVDTYLLPFKFDFGGIINLDDKDELTIEVTVNPSTFNTTGVDENLSFVQFDIIEGVGLETVTPYIKSRVIEANQSNPVFDLGDNITEIVIANYDKIDFKKGNAVLNNLSFMSDKYSRNDSFEEMITRNFAQFQDGDQAGSRIQSFRVYSGYELDAVRLNLNLNTANVNPSQNYILYYCFETDDSLVTKAAMKKKKFLTINNAKGSFKPALAKAA